MSLESIRMYVHPSLSLDPLQSTHRIPCRHDNIEHDVSLSRGDYLDGEGDNFSFNATIYNATLAASNPGVDYYNGTSAGWVQKERMRVAQAENPDVKNTDKEFQIRIQESAFYIITMGDLISQQAPKEYAT